MVQQKKIGWTIILLISTLVGSIGIGYWYFYQHSQKKDNILVFDDTRDTQDIIDIFTRDRYWLLNSPDYSVEFMLKYRAATQDIKYLGKLNINVMRSDDSLIGFVAYYMKKPTKGFLLFLAINPPFRGKGYSSQLVNHALSQLKKMGAHTVNLVTRTDNIRAQKLYARLGFYEEKRDDGYVYYSKYV